MVINTNVSNSRCAIIDRKIYSTGGVSYVRDRFYNRLTTNEVHIYSLDDNKSALMAAMNFTRQEHGCCSHAGHLFVCGGKDGKPSICCEKLIIKDDKWVFIAKMNEARISLQVVSCGKYVWAIGGQNKRGFLNTVEYYDDVIDKWTKSTPMIEKRHRHRAVAFREYIYVIGGMNRSRVLISSEKLDTRSGQWTFISSMRDPLVGFGTAINEHKLYCFGGGYPNERLVKCFDLYSEDWIEEQNMPDAYGFLSAVTLYDA